MNVYLCVVPEWFSFSGGQSGVRRHSENTGEKTYIFVFNDLKLGFIHTVRILYYSWNANTVNLYRTLHPIGIYSSGWNMHHTVGSIG